VSSGSAIFNGIRFGSRLVEVGHCRVDASGVSLKRAGGERMCLICRHSGGLARGLFGLPAGDRRADHEQPEEVAGGLSVAVPAPELWTGLTEGHRRNPSDLW
jgi:hypothetical protein